MAYRAAREAGRSHHDALDAAEAIYTQARPEAMGDPLERIPLTRNRSRFCLWPLIRRAGFSHGSA
jgi:hypothetical protein